MHPSIVARGIKGDRIATLTKYQVVQLLLDGWQFIEADRDTLTYKPVNHVPGNLDTYWIDSENKTLEIF